MTGSAVVARSAPYSVVAGQSLAIACIGAIANFVTPSAPIALAVNIFCLWRLFSVARRYAADAPPGFDPVVAAETIVGFGVVCLVLGLASIISLFVTGRFDLAAMAVGRPEGLLGFVPFVEGLLTAGFAPFFAILLRLTVAEQTEFIDPVEDMSGLARETARLTRTLANASAALEALNSGASAAGASTGVLATVMETESLRWNAAMQTGQAKLSAFGEAARETTGNVAGLAAETERLKASTGDAAGLLDELGKLVQSVEQFVSPRSTV